LIANTQTLPEIEEPKIPKQQESELDLGESMYFSSAYINDKIIET